jgi:hypothetical protein
MLKYYWVGLLDSFACYFARQSLRDNQSIFVTALSFMHILTSDMKRNRNVGRANFGNGTTKSETLLSLARIQPLLTFIGSGFGSLVVSMLASGTQDRGFAPGRSCRIFRAKNSSGYLPSEGK